MHSFCSIVNEFPEVSSRWHSVASSVLRADRGYLSRGRVTLQLYSLLAVNASGQIWLMWLLSRVVFSLCSRGPLAYMTYRQAWPGLDEAFYRTQQCLSDYKAEVSKFVKNSLLRLSCPKLILKYFFLENTRHEDIRSRLFDAGDWRRCSYLHGSCLSIDILRL